MFIRHRQTKTYIHYTYNNSYQDLRSNIAVNIIEYKFLGSVHELNTTIDKVIATSKS